MSLRDQFRHHETEVDGEEVRADECRAATLYLILMVYITFKVLHERKPACESTLILADSSLAMPSYRSISAVYCSCTPGCCRDENS